MKVGTLKILVTGEERDFEQSFPQSAENEAKELEWVSWPVLQYEKLAVDLKLLENLSLQPFEWILFSSPRAVQFWTETLVAAGTDFPLETQVACIGERTADAASNDGYSPDFYPTEPGSEGFLGEFEDLLSNSTHKPTVLIPIAEGGRLKVAERLAELGCQVTVVPLYRTKARTDVRNPRIEAALSEAALLLFTSPSSVEAVTGAVELPPNLKMAAMGNYTLESLKKKGISGFLLPGSRFERVGELL